MKTFNDNAGRTWTITINVDAIKRVRGLLQVNLLDVIEGKLIDRLIGDPVLLCDVLYALVKPEAETKQITDEDFGRAMAGDSIDHATTALLEELVSFFPSPRDRANLQRVLQATWRVMDKARDMIEKRIDSGEIERLAEQTLAQPPKDASDSSGGLPVSSASTPPP